MLSYIFSNEEAPAAFVCYLFMCVCACFYVSVCRLTYLNQSISRQLKSPPTTWISLGTVTETLLLERDLQIFLKNSDIKSPDKRPP